MSSIGESRRLPTVLIIDDDLVSREVMATVLTMSGYTVHTAASGAESLKMLDAATCAPEVILMDTQMPGLSGRTLMEELRKRSAAALYAMSGSQAPVAVTDGADGFLMKPFGPEALQRVLEKHTQQIESAAQNGAPVVNPEILAQWRVLMPEQAVGDIYRAVIADLERRMETLHVAIAQGDRTAVKSIGHAIKGGCGMAGAQQAAKLGEQLETGGDDLESSAKALAQLRDATSSLKRMLDAEFPTPGTTTVG
jgi:CheY-like chemotaxis protein/HPt (histidine-containing phosphotransfer) domain-containing protein